MIILMEVSLYKEKVSAKVARRFDKLKVQNVEYKFNDEIFLGL
jgi:hypothetical protein